MPGRHTATRANESRPSLLPLVLLLCACDAPADAAGAPSTAPAAVDSSFAPPLPTGPIARSATTPAAMPRVRSGEACAPSLGHASRIDQRTEAALARCEQLRTGNERLSLRCGEDGRRIDSLERLSRSVPALDPAAADRARAVARRGRELGRNPRAFGVVGDSISVAHEYLTPLSQTRERPPVLGAWAEAELRLPGGGTVVDRYRGARVERRDGGWLDSFSAFRAAEVGARASWPADGGRFGPIAELERRVSPAVVLVTFGANDAAYRAAPPDDVAGEFERHVLALAAELERRGMIVVLSNEMRHGDQPGVPACPDSGQQSDWRVAVGQNATSARAAEIACREGWAFIDLRHALDGSTNFGLGPDGVHLSSHRQGAGLMTPEGFDCGYNVRNFVTLLALRRLAPILDEVYDSSSQ